MTERAAGTELTGEEHARRRFLEERKTGIGSSDVPAIMGVDKWATARDVWNEKLGVADELPPNEDLMRGHDLEPVAANRFARETGRSLRRRGLVRADPPNDHAIAHIDRHIIAKANPDGSPGSPGILEIKCPRFHKWLEIDRQGANLYMIYQVQHQLACTGWTWARYGIYHPELGLRIFDMPAIDRIQDQIMQATRAFWTDYVLTRTPPPEPEPVELDIPESLRDASIVEVQGPTWKDAIERFRIAQALSRQAEHLLDEAKETIETDMAKVGADAIEGFGLRCYYRWQYGRRTLDKSALRAAALLDPAAVQTALLEAAGAGLIDPDKTAHLIDKLKDCRADVDAYHKQGKPFRSFRPFWTRKEQ